MTERPNEPSTPEPADPLQPADPLRQAGPNDAPTSADQTSDLPPTESPVSQTPACDSDQTQIEQLIDAWEASQEAGDAVEVETLCQDHPDLIDEIRERVSSLKSLDRKSRSRRKSRRVQEQVQILSTIERLHFVSAGGLGEVFVGEDAHLHRDVAIKFMHSRLAVDEESRQKFAHEAEVTGRLEHPGVVPLYGFGCTDDDRLFYAMRYIDGETLDDAIKAYFAKVDHVDAPASESELGVEFRGLLGNFVSVCKTIAYAHNRGIVHRDIKPANVMLGRFGETIVVDWGLAVPVMRDERFKSSGEKTLMPSSNQSGSGSSSGRGAGTPAFMSPEAASDLAPTPASDIYSLGATLFKILSGKPPILSKSLPEIRSNLIDGKLPVLSEIRKDIPKPLQAICEKALARHAKDRYPTALDLAQDVERYLADEPISASEDSISVRLGRIARKHRSATQAAVLGLCACLLIAGVCAAIMGGLANNAERLRNKNLVTSSRLLGRSFGHEFDRIWRILEFVAGSTELKRMVVDANKLQEDGNTISLSNQGELQDWLEHQLGSDRRHRIIDRLVVISGDGTQLARAPLPEQPQVGQNFAFRDYFTGMGFDLEKGSRLTQLIEPLAGPAVHESGVHMTRAYLSTQADENRMKVTLTVPIWDASSPDRCIGVVGTSIDVGDMMRKILGDSDIWLVDLRDTTVDETRYRGLVLAHPGMGKQESLESLPRLSGDVVDQLETRFQSLNTEVHADQIMNLFDPVSQDEVRAAVEPILIDGRGEKLMNLGWIVVAAEGEW